MKLPILELCYSQLSCWPTGVQWESPNISCCCQDNRILTINWWQGSIAEVINTYITCWMLGSGAGAPIETSALPSIIFATERYFAGYQKRKVNTNPATNPLIYNDVQPASYACAMLAQSLFIYLFNSRVMWMSGYLSLVPFPGLFSLFVLSNYDMLAIVLFYYDS